MATNPSHETRRGETSGTPQRSSSTQSAQVARREPFGLWGRSPFASIFQRWNDEMDRLFEDFGVGQSRLTRGQGLEVWAPPVEVFQRGNDLVVRAELPGLSKDDVRVEVNDDVLTIQGERKQEHEEEGEGWYRSERRYGSFHRSVPLPEGAIADSAKASFKNGVLEVVLQAPPREVSRGRKLDIKES